MIGEEIAGFGEQRSRTRAIPARWGKLGQTVCDDAQTSPEATSVMERLRTHISLKGLHSALGTIGALALRTG